MSSEYLREILKAQTLDDKSTELAQLRAHRDDIEALLKKDFGSAVTVRYGGSTAKGTLVKADFDLDVICYFARDDDAAGDDLQTIYESVQKTLASKYAVVPKTSALRLKGKDQVDFHIDVVPGRYIDEKGSDVFIFQKSAEKCRLKTNLDKHIEHIKNSGRIEEIRLAKLWRFMHGVNVKTFVLELAVIEILRGSKKPDIHERMNDLLYAFATKLDAVKIEDPANPTGNDLSEAFDDKTRKQMAMVANKCLGQLERGGWATVFGPLPKTRDDDVDILRRAVANTVAPTKPWRR